MIARTLRPLFVIAAIITLILVTGCGKNGSAVPGNKPPSKTRLKRNVELAQVEQKKLAAFVETVGMLEAEGSPNIAAGVSGVVEEVLFREGDKVEKDKTLLVRIEPKKYESLVAQARATLRRAEANVRRAKANATRADASIKDAVQMADLRKIMLGNIKRVGKLARQEERDEAQAMASVAAARVELTRADKDVTKAELEAAEKDVEAARAMLDLAEHNLRRSRVPVPFTGQINQRKVSRGDYVEDKTIIATMVDLSRMRLVGYIPEKSAPIARQMLQAENALRAGFFAGNALAGPWTMMAAILADKAGETPSAYPLEFEVRPFPKQKFKGRMFYLSTMASADTHLFECKAEIPNAAMRNQLRPGFSAKIKVPLPGRSTSLILPEEAVRASERGFIAFRPKAIKSPEGETEYVAEAVTLELGVRQPGRVEVLKGLNAGDWIIRRGAESLEDGTPLAIPPKQLKLMKTK